MLKTIEIPKVICPVCGGFRVPEGEDRVICTNRCCPIYGKAVPNTLRTDKEALTYLGWIPEKYRIAGFDGYRYFNPKLYRDRTIKNVKYYRLGITYA